MNAEVAVRAATLPEKMQYAEALAFSFMLPEQYRKNPANVLWAIEYGETIGISAMAAITGVHLIEGKPTASSGLISGLVRRAGHRLRSGYDKATRTGWAEIVRFDDPEFTFRAEWDLDRAIEAELVERGPNGELIAKDSKGRSKPWKKFYPSMTKARSITEVARDACEEVLFGLHYTPEELGAETDDEGELVIPGTRRASRPVQVASDPWQTETPTAAESPVEYAEVVDEPAPAVPAPPARPEQINEIVRLFGIVRSVTDAGTMRQQIGGIIGNQIASARELTVVQADSVLDVLRAEEQQAPAAAPAGPTPNDPVAANGAQRMMHALFREKGIGDDDKHAFITRVLGGDIETMARITRSQCDAIIQALTTGEVPTAVPDRVAPSDEGFDEFAALTQMIHDVRDEASFVEAQKAIDTERAAGSIDDDDVRLLRERLAEQAKAMAVAA